MPLNTRMQAEVTMMASIAIFTSFCSSFLPRYSGRAAHHQASDEHRDDAVNQNAVHARAHAAEDDDIGHHVQHRHQAGDRQEAIVRVVDGAACWCRW